MSKRTVFQGVLIAMALLILVSAVGIAAPLAAATTKTLSTNYTLVNLSDTDAVVNVQYLKTDGSVWDADAANESFTVAGNFGQKIVAQYFDTTMSAGKGSAVISSSAPLSAVVQILARNQVPTQGAYIGVGDAAASSKYYVPLILRKRDTASGPASSQLMIQNVETTAVNVTIQFLPNTGYTGYTTPVIPIQPGATFYWDASDESAANLADGWSGSAVVTVADGKKVAVVSNLFSGGNGLQTFNAFPQEIATTSWSVPLFTSRLANGLSTPVAVQNITTTEIAIGELEMECKSTLSTPATLTLSNTVAIPANSAYYFNPVADTTIPGNWTGACTITSSQDVVVFVQMRRPGVTDETASYEAFPATGTDTRVVVPLMSKRQANGFATVATIQNLDTVNSVDVKLTYIPSPSYGGSQTPIVLPTKTIAAGGNLIQNLRFGDVPEVPDGWYGTLLVEPVGTARPIVAFVQLTNILGLAGDTLMAHNAFTLP